MLPNFSPLFLMTANLSEMLMRYLESLKNGWGLQSSNCVIEFRGERRQESVCVSIYVWSVCVCVHTGGRGRDKEV